MADSSRSVESGIDWLLEASQATNKQGFSSEYSLTHGWTDPYLETTGYIIPTLLNLANKCGYRRDEIITTCITSGRWLLSMQKNDGSFTGYNTSQSVVFDTGQILFGLCALYRYSGNIEFLQTAEKSAQWLIRSQLDNGGWLEPEYNLTPRTYHARVAWGLLVVYQLTKKDHYKDAAIKNLNWVIQQQQSNGWFNFSYLKEDVSILHTIAYVLRGLLESSLIVQRDDYLQSVKKVADILADMWQAHKLRSYYNNAWENVDNSFCLTGLMQLVIIFKKLYRIYKLPQYIKVATEIEAFIVSKQFINVGSIGLKGGVAGSFPVWANYMPLSIINWSIKFVLDSYLLDTLSADNQKDVNYAG